MTTLLPAPLPPRTASTPIRNAFINRLLNDPKLSVPSLELLALIDVLNQHLAEMKQAMVREQDE
jgi:hypothetical protein